MEQLAMLCVPSIDPVGGHGLLISGGRGFESQRRQVLILGFQWVSASVGSKFASARCCRLIGLARLGTDVKLLSD